MNNENKMLLGKKTGEMSKYSPEIIFPIDREINRAEILSGRDLPFYGADFWTSYELSWLNMEGKPQVAVGKFIFPCKSIYLIESKSLKLYLNSFNQSCFATMQDVEMTIQNDLSINAVTDVGVQLLQLSDYAKENITTFTGLCLDNLDVKILDYKLGTVPLTTSEQIVSESLYSNLLKTNCLVTNQPDWGSIQIKYHGKQISHDSLLKYLISFRLHNEFHEQCVERIFVDIMKYCNPTRLTVYAKYTRRGGLDISPYRSTEDILPDHTRDIRQ